MKSRLASQKVLVTSNRQVLINTLGSTESLSQSQKDHSRNREIRTPTEGAIIRGPGDPNPDSVSSSQPWSANRQGETLRKSRDKDRFESSAAQSQHDDESASPPYLMSVEQSRKQTSEMRIIESTPVPK